MKRRVESTQTLDSMLLVVFCSELSLPVDNLLLMDCTVEASM